MSHFEGMTAVAVNEEGEDNELSYAAGQVFRGVLLGDLVDFMLEHRAALVKILGQDETSEKRV